VITHSLPSPYRDCCSHIRVIIRYIFLLITAITLDPSITKAQDVRVLVENAKTSSAEHPVVLIKWYSRDLLYPEGVNVYRREEGALSWTKLNAAPIKKKNDMPATITSQDPDLESLVQIIQKATAKDLQVPIIQMNLLIKSFQSNDFADFMGVYFVDESASPDKKYEYRVNRLKAGNELLLGVSPVITAGAYIRDVAVKDVTAKQTVKKIDMNWLQEEERFYAVNVYRCLSTETTPKLLNERPLMLSKIIDSVGRKVYPNPMFSEDLRLEEGKVYIYQVAGLGFFGNETELSAPIEVSFKDVTPPRPPKDLYGKADSMKVHLRWKDGSWDEPVDINIYRGTRSDSTFDRINKLPLGPGVNQYHDNLSIAGPYFYYVAAADRSGNEAHSDLVFTEVQDVIPPAQPQHIAIRMDTGRVNITWTMNTEKDLAGYYIYRTSNRDQKKNYVLLNADPLYADHFSEAQPKNVKSKFFYYIVAVDTSYNRSKPSVAVFGAMPDILAPEKPFLKNASSHEENILIEWIPNVDPDLIGYHIYRADTSKKFTRLNVNLLGKSTYRYTDRDNEPNRDYYYYLVAMDSAGNTSMQSNEMYARRVVKEYVASSKINFRIKGKKKTSVQLAWQYENNAALLGYVVYRGQEENTLQPVSPLIKEHKYTDKISTSDAKGKWYYQVRAYQGDAIIYSQLIKTK
jgi:hypothetical protein